MRATLRVEAHLSLAVADAYRGQRRLTVCELEQMVDTGVIAEEERIELIDGRLVEMAPQGAPHASSKARVATRLRRRLRTAWMVREENPVQIGDHDLPEPDLAVVPVDEVAWDRRHPRGAEVALVVEIARTSQREDRAKATLYARGGVGEYWTLDLRSRRLTVHQGADSDGTWRITRVLTDAEAVAVPGSLLADGAEPTIAIAALLPAAETSG